MQRAPSHDNSVSAQRIAEILRSTKDPWPREAQVNAVDLAQRIVSQSRRMLDTAGAPRAASLAFGSPAAVPVGAPVADAKVGQLAERVSVLTAGLQQRMDVEKQDLEGQVKQVGVQMEERLRILEARMTACEERATAQERNSSDSHAAVSQMALREARTLVSNSMSEADAQWRQHHAELREEQQQQLRQLEEVAEELRHFASRVERAEGALGSCEQGLRRSEEELQDLHLRPGHRPPWFGQLEGATAALEQRLIEQRAATEAHIGRLRADVDGMLRRYESLQGMRGEVLREADERLQHELDRLDLRHSSHAPMHAPMEVSGQVGSAVRDLSRRVDDTETRVAALKVRVDAHDGRLSSVAERSEILCQQALDSARQVCLRQKDEILSEADCQTGILRQRVETLSDLCEELMMRQASPGRCHDSSMRSR